MTTVKARKPLAEVIKAPQASNEMTVEEFLNMKCEEVIKELQQHGDALISKLHEQYEDQCSDIKRLMASSSSG